MDTDRALRVVVIGATGNVGTSVVEALSTAGHIGEIVGAARRPTELAYPKTRFVVADTTTDDIRGLVRGADVVIHLAWLFQPTHRPEVTWNNNVLGAIRVCRGLAHARLAGRRIPHGEGLPRALARRGGTPPSGDASGPDSPVLLVQAAVGHRAAPIVRRASGTGQSGSPRPGSRSPAGRWAERPGPAHERRRGGDRPGGTSPGPGRLQPGVDAGCRRSVPRGTSRRSPGSDTAPRAATRDVTGVAPSGAPRLPRTARHRPPAATVGQHAGRNRPRLAAAVHSA